MVSLIIALLSVASGIKALIAGINIAYDAKEHRGLIKLWAVAVGFAVGGLLVAIFALMLVAVPPAVLSLLPLNPQMATIIVALRWPVLAVIAIVGLSILYRWGPCRLDARWRWITWGSALCTTLWIVGWGLISLYVANFGKYDQTYGSIGGAIVLLLWLYFSAFTVLLGAEVDAELEQRHGIATSHESLHARNQPARQS